MGQRDSASKKKRGFEKISDNGLLKDDLFN
jgi:hypothetical protein